MWSTLRRHAASVRAVLSLEPHATCWFCGRRYTASQSYWTIRTPWENRYRCPTCDSVNRIDDS